MTYEEFTFEKLSQIPIINWDKKDNNRYDSVIIVPMNDVHDSGYRCMTYLFCRGNTIVARNNGCSDVLHLDGIGGYGDWTKEQTIPKKILPKAWRVDCLPNGFLRIFCRGKIKNGNGLSDYDIFADVK